MLAVPAPLVPVKALAEAKGRLAPWLGPIERRLLTIAMLEDVVAALQGVSGLERPAVVSPDPEIWRRADAMGCRVIEERPGAADLNRSLTRGAASLDAGDGLLVVAADLPLASAEAIGRVLDAASEAPPSWSGPPRRAGPGAGCRHRRGPPLGRRPAGPRERHRAPPA